MKTLVIFKFILATTTASVLDSLQLDNVEIKGRITNGKKATEGQFPYQVGLLFRGGPPNRDWCSGCLIGQEWVLTAAHCLIDVKIGATVYLGSTIRSRAEKIYHVSKDKFIQHSDFDGKSVENDIALIKIPAATLSKKIQIIKLPSLRARKHSKYVGKSAIVSGWGKISDKAPLISSDLQWAKFKIISNKACKRTISFITDTSMCIATRNFVSPCIGDSGGPLVLKTDRILVGVDSFILGDNCELGYPAGFTRLTNYLNWINLHTHISY